jgi:hypothetical protein
MPPGLLAGKAVDSARALGASHIFLLGYSLGVPNVRLLPFLSEKMHAALKHFRYSGPGIRLSPLFDRALLLIHG